MRVFLGEKGLKETWQEEFPKTTKCVHCKGESRIGFVAGEGGEEKRGNYVSNLHENKPKSMWLHDACAVAVYFCKECLEPTALYNQA